jgi:hypothetical protein
MWWNEFVTTSLEKTLFPHIIVLQTTFEGNNGDDAWMV